MRRAPLSTNLHAGSPAGLALVVGLALCVAGTAQAAPQPPPPVLLAQGDALWLLGAKDAKSRLGPLPAELGAATSLQADAVGRTVLVGSARGWFWASVTAPSGLEVIDVIDSGDAGALQLSAWRKLPCAAGRATLAPDGARVLCGTATGTTMVVNLASGQRLTRNLAVEHASLVGMGAGARLVWTDARGIWGAAIASVRAADGKAASDTMGPAQLLAPQAPRRGFSVNPLGTRALGVYEGPSHRGKQLLTQELLFGFALDGKAVRRKAIAGAVVKTWAADGAWALVQDKTAACIMAATGGQYKCWKGYRAEAISADGRYALLVGDKGEDRGEDASDGKSRSAGKPGRGGEAASKSAPPARGKSASAKAAASASGPAATTSPTAAPAPATHATTSGLQLPDDAVDDGPGAPADGQAGPDDDEEEGEPSGASAGEEGAMDGEDPSQTGEHAAERHLYRAVLEGAFTAPPTRLVPEFRGPAVFLERTANRAPRRPRRAP